MTVNIAEEREKKKKKISSISTAGGSIALSLSPSNAACTPRLPQSTAFQAHFGVSTGKEAANQSLSSSRKSPFRKVVDQIVI